MPWYFPWSDSLKKRACRYLLQHYLGQFLKEKLTLDQLSVDLYKGTGTIHDVLLDVQSINEALDSYNVPVEIVDGFVGAISVTIPWSALVSDNTVVEIRNLEVTLQPRQRDDTTGVMLESMFSSFSSMTTSMQLAEECLRQDNAAAGVQQADSAQPFEGLEMFAQTIEAVLSRIKVSFIDTIVRLEHLPKEAKTGAALEIRINRMEYFDDQAVEPGSSVDQPKSGLYEPAAVALKNVQLMGTSVYCDEFPAVCRTFSRESSQSNCGSPNSSATKSPDFGTSPSDDLPGHMPTHKMEASTDSTIKDSDPIKIAVFGGRQELKIKLKQNDELAGPKLELDCQIGSVNMHLSPRQLHLLLEIANGLSSPDVVDDSNMKHGRRRMPNKPMEMEDFAKVERDLQKQLSFSRLHPQKLSEEGLMSHPLDEDEDEEVYFSLGAGTGVPSMDGSFSSSASTTSRSSAGPPGFPLRGGSQVSYQTVGFSKKVEGSPFQATIPKQLRAAKHKSKHKDSLHKLLDDPAAELTRYRVKVSFLSVLLLHEEPPASPSDDLDPHGTSSTDKLKDMADKYFGRVVGINITGVGQTLANIRAQYSDACPFDHIGLLCKPVSVECNSKSSSAVSSSSADVSVGVAELVEAVFDRRPGGGVTHSIKGFHLPIDNILPEYCQLLTFEEDEQPASRAAPAAMFSSLHAASTPCVRIKLDMVQRRAHLSGRGSSVPSNKMDVHVELAACQGELDMTIVDRIHTLLNPQPLVVKNGAYAASSLHPNMFQSSQAVAFTQAMDEGPNSSDQQTDLKISASSFTLKFRFPIPDLRVGTDASKPWWRRCLRQESLLLRLTDADFHTHLAASSVSSFEVTCRDAHGLFEEEPGKPPVSFIRIGAREGASFDRDEGFDLPRVVVKFVAEEGSVLEEEVEDASMPTPDSLNGACNFPKPPPSPFSSRKVIYESEEMVMPGDRCEMAEFQEKALSASRTVVELSFPNVNARLHDKKFLELLYNRIVNDVILWQPAAPAPVQAEVGPGHYLGAGQPWSYDLAAQLIRQQDTPQFSMCKSVLHDVSSSDEDDDEPLYSITDGRRPRRRVAGSGAGKQQSKMALVLNIHHGKLSARLPLKDGEKDEAAGGSDDGEFLLQLGDAALTLVSQFSGDPDLSYLALQAHTAMLYHNGCVGKLEDLCELERASYSPPTHLDPCLYLSEPGVATNLQGKVGVGGDSEDQLSMAMRIHLNTFHNVKEYVMALGVRGTTLRHKMTQTGHSWFEQLLELFDLVDYPIAGYTLPKIITELHTHIWSCAIDYRPLSLPYKALVTIETFSISSNIIAESQASLLRFMVDDAALYISDRLDVREIDVQKYYVCVVDIGMFELSLRTTDGKDPKHPKRDLKASNNIVHIRTCADSMHALAELIQYFATDGDLHDDPEGRQQVHTRAQVLERSESSSTLSSSPQLTQSCVEQVHDMMADAMLESHIPQHADEAGPSARVEQGGRLYFQQSESEASSIASSMVESGAGGGGRREQLEAAMMSSQLEDSMDSSLGQQPPPCYSSEEEEGEDEADHINPDDEFCIIDDPGLGIAPRDGQPVIRSLTSDPIVIKDNYFSQPAGKTDLLRPPEHFPVPTHRYTLGEMSLVWYMYGGKDFKSSPPSKTVSAKMKQGGSRLMSWMGGAPLEAGTGGKVGWQARGGPGRDVNVLTELQLSKVRLQYEQYPDNTMQASRQIMLIKDIEIRDRLISSKINKLLYRYTSDKIPRQSQANMLLVKALHVRPDPSQPGEECSLRVSLQPIRLNVDQDALFFMKTFFGEVSGAPEHAVEAELAGGSCESDTPRPSTPPPVMQVGPLEGEVVEDEPDALIMFDEMSDDDVDPNTDTDDKTQPATQPVFFKSLVFSPDVPIRLDYHGKRVDMEHGTLTGLLVGLGHLNCSQLKLKRIHHRRGLLGLKKVLMFALTEWLQDIKKNQLPSILGGVGPLHSLVQLVQGVRDLFWLPVEQYQRDGRIVRGLQRGANSFITCTAMSALELTNRLVQSVQFIGEVGYDMVTPGPSVRRRRREKWRRTFNQPSDLREGVTNACNIVKEGFRGTAETLVRVAVEEHEQKGMTGAVGGVLRQVPPTIIQPVIIATEATANILGGMRNQLLPDRKREDEDKWKPQEEDD